MRALYILTISMVFITIGTTITVPVQAGDLLIQMDNDKVVDTDRHYTNGMRIAYTPTSSADLGIQFKETTQTMAEFMAFKSVANIRTGWVIGQEMYTPENVDLYIPDPKDRPYAGWSYFGLTAQSSHFSRKPDGQKGGGGFDRQDTFELDLGMIGPASKAAETQTAFHRLINVSVSRGWNQQIHSEFGVLGTRIIKFRTKQRPLFGLNGLQTDAIFHGIAHMGNVKTALGTGLTLRLGGNLNQDFGPVYGTFALPHKKPDVWVWSAFAGFETRAVARDIFLDGNTFTNSPDVKKNPFIIEARMGLTSHIPVDPNWGVQAIRVSIDMVQRTREFTTQDKADRYGSLQMTINF